MTTGQHPIVYLRHRLEQFRLTVRDYYDDLNLLTRNALTILLRLLVVVYFIFCALFLVLRYGVLPQIEHYKTEIAQAASQAIGRPLSFDTLEATWRGLRPTLTLTNVVVHDQRNEAALSLPRISATIAWSSLLGARLQLERLEINRPDVDIRRDADGKLYVGGIYMDTGKPDDGKGLDWVLSQGEIAIHGGRLSWLDEKRGAPELVLENVDFVLRNGWWRHRFALKASPPAAFAKPLDIRADFSHPHLAKRISDFSQWVGTLYADVRGTDLAAWKAYIDYPVELTQGQGAVRAWLAFDRARIADLTADLHLTDVSTRLRKDLQAMDLTRVNGRISLREELDGDAITAPVTAPAFGAYGHAVALTDFSFATREGLVFPNTTMTERYLPARRNQPERIELRAKVVDLRTLADFAERLPLAAGQREMFASFLPRGQLKDIAVQWQGTYPHLVSYSIKGQFIGLSMNSQAPRPAQPARGKQPAQAALPGIPGFDNLTGSIDANDKEGHFTLASSALRLNLPGYFSEPIMAFDRLDMRAGWVFDRDDQLLLQIDQMQFAQQGVSGSFAGTHKISLKEKQGDAFGEIDLTGKINEIALDKVANYLPAQTPEHLRKWLQDGLLGGKAQNLSIRLKGKLSDFPFNVAQPDGRPKGEFQVSGRIVDGRINYDPTLFAKDGKSPLWPLAEEIKGSIRFDRSRMEIRADSALTKGVQLTNVKAVVPDLMAHSTILDIDGNAAGPMQRFLDYVARSPVSEWIGDFTEDTKASGNAKLALKLHLPLASINDAKVQGALQFDNNDIVLFDGMPELKIASGKLEFSEKGFTLPPLKANFLGAQAEISGGSQGNGDILVKAAGGISADGVRKAYPLPAMQRVAKSLNGSTRYSATVFVKKHGHPEITVESSLQGLGLNFPVPLNKPAKDAMPLKLQLVGLPATGRAQAAEEIRMTLGSTLSARYERQKGNEKNAVWRVVRGGIGVNVPAPQPDSGLIANVNLRSLSLDDWNDYIDAISGDGGDSAAASAATPASAWTQYVDPDVLAVSAVELFVAGRKLDNVVVGASHQQNVWQANIDSEQASGYLTWQQSRSGRGMGRVTARLATLIIPKSAVKDVSDLLEGKKATTQQIPALDIVAENFELFGKKLGQLELQAKNSRGPIGREWLINSLKITNPDGKLDASGKWVNQNGVNQTSLNYTLDIADAGRLLDRFGYEKVLRGGRGKLNGDINWRGLPFSLDIPSLTGNLTLDIGAGQFLKVEPSAAKLLGVLSLQSIPRRLALDFRDVFAAGFAFDNVAGNATIERGVAKTDSFKMRGLAATVGMDGTVDIARETTNLHVVVIPEINADATIGLVALNPAIGIGAFLAQLFLREPLKRAFTFEYQITGPWSEPVVTKLERKTDHGAAGQSSASAITSVEGN
ncbi:MAG: TIGR02099 family protein [Proteobacteria bacterium]|nr:TIGR02099 family protein [Pseudomonadota bacterium]